MWFASRIARVLRGSSAVLAALSLLCPALPAQAPPASLQITIIDGDEAINNIRQRTAREPIVQVEDENHKPIAGAAVIFLLPNDGAGGVFPGGARTLTTVTDSKGQAVARGLRPNHAAGKYQIKVQANYQGKTAQTTINQTNSAGTSAGSSSSIMPKWLAVVVAGAVGGTIAAIATHNGSGSNTSTSVPVAVTPGTGTVGPPR
jgi:hypothetical protein